MSSLQCSNCKYGMHCTEYPNDIERYAFPLDDWKKLVTTDLPIVRYMLDGPQSYLTIWECPECGCLHLFKADDVKVEKAFKPVSLSFLPNPDAEKYILFDSAHYEPIAESGITGAEYDGISHRYFSFTDNIAVISDDENFSENSIYYEAVNIAE